MCALHDAYACTPCLCPGQSLCLCPVHVSRSEPLLTLEPTPAAVVAPARLPPPSCVMHVAVEYTVPHLNFGRQFVYSGVGKVCRVAWARWCCVRACYVVLGLSACACVYACVFWGLCM